MGREFTALLISSKPCLPHQKNVKKNNHVKLNSDTCESNSQYLYQFGNIFYFWCQLIKLYVVNKKWYTISVFFPLNSTLYDINYCHYLFYSNLINRSFQLGQIFVFYYSVLLDRSLLNTALLGFIYQSKWRTIYVCNNVWLFMPLFFLFMFIFITWIVTQIPHF